MQTREPTGNATFDSVWPIAEPVKGWLTREQARLLWDEAVALRGHPTIVEIGSHHGRSTLILAKALAGRGQVIAIDPFVEGRLFGGSATRGHFEANLARAGVSGDVDLVMDYSTRVRPKWHRSVDYLYIDGKHDYWTLADDLRWADHLPDGSPVLVHDCFSSIGVTLGVLAHVLPSRRLRYERRTGSLALFRIAAPSRADRLRILREIPWWMRNVGIKVLLRLRLRGLAQAVGHDSPYDPY
ncbi:conserved hypothetical protein [Nostocoides australiense Ben110]|uniref:Class I SAM-dependent methyltransferase n=1 Tax=Nostocoides australiense Ben110 TaxID=1193182 RepID=W6K1D4_9MICO|nr:class I SAM-dependent methyltransferase [Tetrasphaera australiensis]CCH72084.1 conserved hypothetical protein [Tetrasphaera australiensis Ben110]